MAFPVPLLLLGAAVALPAAAAPTRAAECAQEALDADSGPGSAALDLAQRQQRALLAPRAAGRRGAAAALPPLGFVKTHKTGSSTAVNILHRLSLERSLKTLTPNEGAVINWRTLPMREPPKNQYDLICNHQAFNSTAMRAYMKPSAFLFSVVRDPLAMADSRFRWKASKGEINRFQAADTWERRLKIIRSEKNMYANSMARDFGWYDGVDIRRHTDGEGDYAFRRDNDTEAVARFVEWLDRTLDLVFLTERYDEGLILLGQRTGLGLDDLRYVRMKESNAEEIAPPTDQERRDLEEFLAVDNALFAHFSKRFQRDWDAAGGDAVLGPEVQELRRRNAELERACAEPRNATACPSLFLADTRDWILYLMFHPKEAAKLIPSS